MKTFEQIIDKEGRLLYTNVGDSMLPLIKQDKDIIVIEKIKRKLKKYDVPLYKRDSGQYVLHRILKVRKKDYVLCGDNRYWKEYGITDENIIGIMTAVIHNGKEIKTTSARYRIYTHLWCDLYFLRMIILKMKNILKRILKKYC